MDNNNKGVFETMLSRIIDYFQSMERMDDKWVICVKFNPKWGVYQDVRERIGIEEDQTGGGVWWYFAKDSSVSVEEIITFIEETANTNIEALKKIKLLREKVDELKSLFSKEENTFAKLSTLKFVFTEPITISPKEGKKQPKEDKKKKHLENKQSLIETSMKEMVDEDVHEVLPVKATEMAIETSETPEEAQSFKTSLNGLTSEDIKELRGGV